MAKNGTRVLKIKRRREAHRLNNAKVGTDLQRRIAKKMRRYQRAPQDKGGRRTPPVGA